MITHRSVGRRFIATASLATGAVVVGGVPTLLAHSQATVRRETADLITGPFYPRIKPLDKDADMDDAVRPTFDLNHFR